MSQGEPPEPGRRTPARPRGTPRAGAAVPRMENVRVTAPDLARRAQLDRARSRLSIAGIGFVALFGALALRLAVATVIFPHLPPPDRVASAEVPPVLAEGLDHKEELPQPTNSRATIQDRNGQILAVSLPTADVYADPKEMIDTDQAAHKLKQALPDLNEAVIRERLASAKSFVYIARHISPRDEEAINALGIPGVYFQETGSRHYPLGRVAAQVLGAVDSDQHGVAGAERAFDDRLRNSSQPLRLSIDVRVQAIVREELDSAMTTFDALGAAGIVMDVNTGEVLAMVSLPDYDANNFGTAPDDARFNRVLTGRYEPGSTFKLQTAAMALDGGIVHIWDEFDAAHPIHIGRFTITDFEGKHRFLYLPEVLAYSSNLGAAHIAEDVGPERQRAWLASAGFLNRVGIELPEQTRPLFPPVSNWKEAATLTIGFGHGIAISPMHVVRGTATLADGGILRPPTILALPPGAPPPEGRRLVSQTTSDTIRKLMRLVVTDGYGKPAEVPGYYVGGKTGTAEKVGAHGAYEKHTNVSAFISVFPMNAPRYAVYMMLDSPHATAATHGYTTAAWVAAPYAGHVIARIGPMLGLYPDTADAAAINAALAIPLQPARPPGVKPGPMVSQFPSSASAAPAPRNAAARLPAPRLPAPAAIPAISAPIGAGQAPRQRHTELFDGATTQPVAYAAEQPALPAPVRGDAGQ